MIGCILLFFWLIGMLRANVILAYDGQFSLKIRVLFLSIPITPKKEKKPPDPDRYSPEKYRKMLDKAAQKEAKKQQKKAKKAQKKQEKSPKNANPAGKSAGAPKKKEKKSVSDILGLVSQILAAVKGLFGSFGKHLRIEAVRLHVTVASEDAAKTALLYGAVCQSAAYLLEILSSVTNFKAKDREQIRIDADFLSEKSTADVHLIFRLRVWHVFAMLFSALGGFLKKRISSKA